MVQFARERGWIVRDGHIVFPSVGASATVSAAEAGAAEEEGQEEMSRMAIENTLGYARELETIV